MAEASGTFDNRAAVVQEAAPKLLSRIACHPTDYADLFFEMSHRSTFYRVDYRAFPSRRISRKRGQRIEGLSLRRLTLEAETSGVSDGWAPESWQDLARQIESYPSSTNRISIGAARHATRLPPDAPEFISDSEKEALVASLSEMALTFDSAVAQCAVEYQDTTRRTLLVNTAGDAILQAAAWFGLHLRVTLYIDRQCYVAYATRGSTDSFGRLVFGNLEKTVQEAIGRARSLAGARRVPAGPMPVVFAGGWGGVWLHEALGHALEADALAPDSIRRRIGDAVAAPAVTIVDDALLPEGHGSFAFDDEGAPGQRTVLVDRGRLRHLLADRRTARRDGLPITGNGRRQDYRHSPLPRMSNLCLMSGTAAPADLIASVDQGLYVNYLSGGCVLSDSDMFELYISEARLIEKGCLTYPVQALTLRGSRAGFLQNIHGIGADGQPDFGTGRCQKNGQIVPVSVYAPTVLIESLEAIPNRNQSDA